MNPRMSKLQWAVVLGLVSVLAFGRVAQAQTNAEVNAGTQFSFLSPGARSLALGGAFIGLADDATAAFTNPAGLTVLSKPEVSAEGRRTNAKNQFTDSGHILGTPAGVGVDTVSGLVTGQTNDTTTNLSFSSFVYPHGPFAVAVYRQELANFHTGFGSQGAFFGPNSVEASVARLFPVSTSLDLRIINVGVSGGFKVTDNLSLGVGISDYHFDLSSLTNRFGLNGIIGPGGFFSPPLLDPSNIVNQQTLNGSESDVAVNAGLLWKINSMWSLGAVYREGPKFSFTTQNVLGPANPPGFPGPGDTIATNTAVFHVPDVYGAGLAFRPADSLTITFDYDRIRYSQLTQDTVDVFSEPTLVELGLETAENISKLKIDDANEFHLGLEYVITSMTVPLALRVGGWVDPDHRVRFEGTPQTEADMDLAALFRKGKMEAHVSGGFGLVFGNHFQVDAAYDYSKLLSIASLSGVFRF
jgi:long-chain fatty acid transport protein